MDILTFIQQFKHPALDVFFEAVTMSAEEIFFILAAGWLLWCHDKQLGYRLGFALLTSATINPVIKHIVRFERPIGLEGIVSERLHTATGFSFPSGHTQGATAFWTGLMTSVRRRWLTVAGCAMILLVALSRLYLGVHWLTDVLGGIACGLAWVLACNALFDYAKRLRRPWLLGLLLLPLAGACVVINLGGYDKDLTVAFAVAVGFWLGYVVEERYIHFNVRTRRFLQFLKLLVGLAILVALKEGLKILLPFPTIATDSIRYGLMGFWISAGAPATFKLLKLDGPATA
ncbi:MAG: hypothetical protein A2087_06445 [Spirochaetes bacterium GWD1_61_31]|nr:MAG: hypothetical protein A2Y37_09025 [Spirochaetes bacterium GWB1_60_80]OHD31920.1 MAG: hypothetical protein A2004_10410 [Spirochaetes bacterium GWC1_61_12]OHD40253.1 MAG: hypothetical protein A2087_06445 [Spirochaetes bacterium GWD1_61_31]OHD42373.1 MAG: hypothetical protein A2Y35_11555 [Spirochaetes bacterium GWE1_60_18]OHD60552.1 MAG: hypothetical protein A2Y32_03770 [Spirochaetes bacterium GWF1_60_12]